MVEILKKINIKLIIEIILLIIVFSVSLYYNLRKSQTFLISDCSTCNGKCITNTELKSGINTGHFDLNLLLETKDSIEYSYTIFTGQFTSCMLINPDNLPEVSYVSVEYLNISSTIYKKEPNPLKYKSKNITINAYNCFSLTCLVENGAGHKYLPGYLTIPEYVKNNITAGKIRLFGELLIQQKNVVGNCYVNINDYFFNFLSISNSFTNDDLFLCEIYQDISISMSVALTYTLTTLSVIKIFNKIIKFLNKNNLNI